ncbi:MAG: hypothetical protein ABIU06_20890 [Anaerolineales bacterium]
MGIPIGKWSGSDSIDELHKTIREFNEASSKQTKQLIILTWVIAVLTILMLIGLVIQIYLAITL